MIRVISVKFFFGLSLLIAVSGTAIASDTGPAVSIAESWMQLIDEGNYEDSWKQASAFFKSVLTAKQWADAVVHVRSPLGGLVSRKLTSATYSETLPNAPPGEYVVITYSTEFANRTDNTEAITVMIDDQQWKVTGYFVK